MSYLLAVFPWANNGPLVLSQFLSGMSMAMFLVLFSLGLNMTFGVARIVNFGHGSFYMLGAYLMVTLSRLGTGPLWFVISILLSAAIVAVVGGLIEATFIRKIYKKGKFSQFILTFAIGLIINGIVRIFWGVEFQSIARPEFLAGTSLIAEQPFPVYSIFVLLVVPVVIGVAGLLLAFSNWGLKIRAASTDREMLEALGTDANRLLTQMFMVSCVLAGIAGAIAAPTVSVGLNMGSDILLSSFVVVVIGGLGSLWGSLVGAIIVGELQAFGVLSFPEISFAFMYVAMILVLFVRPWGLFGSAEGRNR